MELCFKKDQPKTSNIPSSEVSNMRTDPIHIRHCILYEFQQGKTAAKACESICSFLGEEVVSYDVCAFWFRRFKSGDFNVTDKQRTGAPRKCANEDLEQLLNDNSTLTQTELAKEFGVTQQTVSIHLHEMGKVHKEGKYIPHNLTESNKNQRLVTCLSLLNRHRRKSFLWKIITGDEKWIKYDNPKRRKSWVNPGEPSTSVVKPNNFGKKVMLCIWWDIKGILYYELLEPGETVCANRYQEQLNRLSENLELKRPFNGKGKRPVKFLHDNARPHIASKTKDTLMKLGWEILEHPAYSPDIAPTDYHLFRSMQNALSDTHFKSVDSIRKWIDEFMATKQPEFFRDGIHQLPVRWLKVINNNGDYFD